MAKTPEIETSEEIQKNDEVILGHDLPKKRVRQIRNKTKLKLGELPGELEK